MPTVPVGLLPPPHFVEVRDASVLRTSSIGRMPFFRQPDPQLAPRRLTFTWEWLPAAAADLIRRQYDENPHTLPLVALPRTGETVRVQFAGPPSIQWASARFASSVTVEADEVPVHE